MIWSMKDSSGKAPELPESMMLRHDDFVHIVHGAPQHETAMNLGHDDFMFMVPTPPVMLYDYSVMTSILALVSCPAATVRVEFCSSFDFWLEALWSHYTCPDGLELIASIFIQRFHIHTVP